MKNFTLLACMCIVAFAACKKSSNTTTKFSFGTAYSMCAGDCADFYQLDGDILYKDNMPAFLSWPPVFDYSVALPHSKYQMARALLDSFPAYLLNSTDSVYGCPDCHDQGGVHLRLEQNGIQRSWHLDTEAAYLPPALKPYVQQVMATIKKLQ
jgi:hypothetical protein